MEEEVVLRSPAAMDDEPIDLTADVAEPIISRAAQLASKSSRGLLAPVAQPRTTSVRVIPASALVLSQAQSAEALPALSGATTTVHEAPKPSTAPMANRGNTPSIPGSEASAPINVQQPPPAAAGDVASVAAPYEDAFEDETASSAPEVPAPHIAATSAAPHVEQQAQSQAPPAHLAPSAGTPGIVPGSFVCVFCEETYDVAPTGRCVSCSSSSVAQRAPALPPPRLSPALAASSQQQQPQQQPWLCRVCFAGHLRGKFPGHLATEPGVVSDREATLAALQQLQLQGGGGGSASPPLQSPPRPSAVGSSPPSSSAFSPSPSRPAAAATATPFRFDPGAPCSMGHRGQAVVLYCLDCAGRGGGGPLPLCSLCVPLHAQQFRQGHATLPAARVAAACRAHLTGLCEAAGAWPAPDRFSLELLPDPVSPKPASRGGLQYFESPALASRGGDRSARRLLASRGGSTSQGGRRPATSAVMLDPALLPPPSQQQQQQQQQQLATARSVTADIAGAASAISRAALAVAQAAADAEAAAAVQFGAVVAAAEARRAALVDRIRAEAASKAAALAEELAAAEVARERAASDCGFVARAARSLADPEVVAAHAALVARLRAMFGAVAAALPPGAPAPAADSTLLLQRADTAPIIAALGTLGDVACASVTAADCVVVGLAPGQTVAPGETLRFSLALSPESLSRGGLLASRAALARLVSAATAHVTLGPPIPEEDEDGLVPAEVPAAPQRLQVTVEFDDDLEEGERRQGGGGCGVWLTCSVPAEAAAAAAPLAPTPLPMGGAAPAEEPAPLALLAHSRRPRVGSGGEGQGVAAARPPLPPAPSAAPLVVTIVSVSSGRWSVPGLPLRLRVVEGSGVWGGSLSHRSASPSLSQSGGSSSAALAAGTGLREVVPRGRRLSASSYPHQHPHPYHVHIHAEPPPPLPLLSATVLAPPPLLPDHDRVLGGGAHGPLAATAAAAAALRKKPGGRDGSRSPSPSPSHTVASNYALSAAAAHPPPPLPVEALPLWFTQPGLAHTHFSGGASGSGGAGGGSFVRSRGGAVTPLQVRPGASSPAPVLLPPVAAAGAKLPTRIPEMAASGPTAPCVSTDGTIFVPLDATNAVHMIGGDGGDLRPPLAVGRHGVSRVLFAAFDEPTGTLVLGSHGASAHKLVAIAAASNTLRWASPIGNEFRCGGLALLPRPAPGAPPLIVHAAQFAKALCVYRLVDGARVAVLPGAHHMFLAVDPLTSTVYAGDHAAPFGVSAYQWVDQRQQQQQQQQSRHSSPPRRLSLEGAQRQPSQQQQQPHAGEEWSGGDGRGSSEQQQQRRQNSAASTSSSDGSAPHPPPPPAAASDLVPLPQPRQQQHGQQQQGQPHSPSAAPHTSALLDAPFAPAGPCCLMPLGPVDAVAGVGSHFRPLCVVPPAPGRARAYLVVGAMSLPTLLILSLPSRALVHTHTLPAGVRVGGLAADPRGTRLFVVDTARRRALHILAWPLPGMPPLE